MLKRISARLFALILLLSLTAIGGCASTGNSGWFDGGALFSAMPWGGAPSGQTEPELVYEDMRMKQTEPE
jgi:hypothetical protein